MLRKIKSFLSRNEVELKKNDLIDRIVVTRTHNDVLVLYGSPTEGNWLGIANATKSLFPDCAVEVPQYYSNPTFDTKQTNEICNAIIKLNFKCIIISGFAPYFYHWINLLGEKTTLKVLYHFTFAEAHNDEVKHSINSLINYCKSEKIQEILFVKKGLAELMTKLYGFKCSHAPLPEPIVPTCINKISTDKSKFHIGVFGADTFNKNLHNQVVNALAIENTVVHVLDDTIFNYLEMGDRIVGHGKNLKRETFLSILGSMDLNLYMSYSESWGLVAAESEALGVPCIKTIDTDFFNIINKKIKQYNDR